MRFGMLGWGWAVSQTVSAASVIPGVWAIARKVGAAASGDRVWLAPTAWQEAQMSSASRCPCQISPTSCAWTVATTPTMLKTTDTISALIAITSANTGVASDGSSKGYYTSPSTDTSPSRASRQHAVCSTGLAVSGVGRMAAGPSGSAPAGVMATAANRVAAMAKNQRHIVRPPLG